MLTPMGLDFVQDMARRPCGSPRGGPPAARGRASVRHASGVGCEVALPCLREGQGVEPGLSETSQRRRIIPLDAQLL